MRFNGGVIGNSNEANSTAASGVWGWDEQFMLRVRDSFPNRIIGFDLYNIDLSTLEPRIVFPAITTDVFFKPDGLSVYATSSASGVYQYDLRTPWDVRTAYPTLISYTNPQESALTSLFFKSDGTKMYLLGTIADTVYQFTLATPWNISSATYDSVAYSVGAETFPQALAFSADGDRMYVLGYNSDTVREYILSTPWSLSPVTVGGSYSVSSQGSSPSGLRFSSNGALMYVSDSTGTAPRVFQYNLATPWQPNTASYSSQFYPTNINSSSPSGIEFNDSGNLLYISDATTGDLLTVNVKESWNVASAVYEVSAFSVAAQEITPEGLAFSNDGSLMYIVGSGSDRVFQYALTTPWDVTTASNSATSFSVAGQDTAPYGISFKPDGTKMYVLGDTGNDLNQYSLSEAWNVGSASFDSITFSFTTEGETSPRGHAFKDDGTKLYVTGNLRDNVYQYSLSESWNIATASYDSVFFYVGGEDTSPQGIAFRDNGSRMYVIGFGGDDVNQYILSEAWNVASATFSSIFNPAVTPDISTPSDLAFSEDGLTLYILDSTRDAVYSFPLQEADNTTTALSNVYSYSVASQETIPTGIALHPEGTRIYVVGSASDRVHQYDLDTPFSLRTARYNNVSATIGAQESTAQDLAFKPDGTKMYIVGTNQDRVFQYTLSTPWDVGSASYDSISYLVSSQENSPTGLDFKPDGTKMYIVGSNYDNVHQYSLSSAWDVSTASYDSVSFSVLAEATTSSSVTFKPDGKVMYITGTTNDAIYQYSLSTPWNIGTASNSTLKTFFVRAIDNSPAGIAFSPNGTKLYLVGSGSDAITELLVN